MYSFFLFILSSIMIGSAHATCYPGQSSDENGECFDCDPGKYSSGIGGPCRNCTSGKISDFGYPYCNACPAGSSSSDGITCTACPDRKTTHGDGGPCFCEPAYQTLGDVCVDAYNTNPHLFINDTGNLESCPHGLIKQQVLYDVRLGDDINGVYTHDNSGYSVALSSDGSVVAIGAPGYNTTTGYVHVYERNGIEWIQRGVDIYGETANDYSGYSVALSPDGSIMAVSAPYNSEERGKVRVYYWDWFISIWNQLGDDIIGNDYEYFGWSVALSSSDGLTTMAIGAPGTSKVRVYTFDHTSEIMQWVQRGTDIFSVSASDDFGASVALSSNGSTVAIGAPFVSNHTGQASVYIWNEVYEYWQKRGDDIVGEADRDEYGYSVSLSSDGTIVAIGAPYNDGNGTDSGHVRVYQWDGSAWNKRGNDIVGEAQDDLSGWSVSLSSDGSTVAIGAPHNNGNGASSGHVRVYKWNDNEWSQIIPDITGNNAGDGSGFSVALSSDGSVIATGIPYNDDNGEDSGQTYIRDVSSTDAITTAITSAEEVCFNCADIQQLYTSNNCHNTCSSNPTCTSALEAYNQLSCGTCS